jgi:hypothetical protein
LENGSLALTVSHKPHCFYEDGIRNLLNKNEKMNSAVKNEHLSLEL